MVTIIATIRRSGAAHPLRRPLRCSSRCRLSPQSRRDDTGPRAASPSISRATTSTSRRRSGPRPSDEPVEQAQTLYTELAPGVESLVLLPIDADGRSPGRDSWASSQSAAPGYTATTQLASVIDPITEACAADELDATTFGSRGGAVRCCSLCGRYKPSAQGVPRRCGGGIILATVLESPLGAAKIYHEWCTPTFDVAGPADTGRSVADDIAAYAEVLIDGVGLHAARPGRRQLREPAALCRRCRVWPAGQRVVDAFERQALEDLGAEDVGHAASAPLRPTSASFAAVPHALTKSGIQNPSIDLAWMMASPVPMRGSISREPAVDRPLCCHAASPAAISADIVAGHRVERGRCTEVVRQAVQRRLESVGGRVEDMLASLRLQLCRRVAAPDDVDRRRCPMLRRAGGSSGPVRCRRRSGRSPCCPWRA